MKKAIFFTIFFTVLLFVYQFVVIFLENGHELTYKIETENKTFIVKESYLKQDSIDGYYIRLSTDNKIFNFFVKNQYNKQKKVITNVKYIEKDGYLCVYPVPMKEDNNIDIICSYEDKYYNVSYVKDKVDINDFINEYESVKKYSFDSSKSTNRTDYYYQKNIESNEYVALYKYSSFVVYHDKSTKRVALYFKDVYVNELGAFLDYYYLSPNIVGTGNTKEYLLVNLKDATSRVIYLDRNFSTNSYNLGVVDHKLYVFDLTNKVEYEFDTYGNYNIVGDSNKGYRFYRNKEWESVPVTEFTESRSTFEKKIDVPFKYDEIYDASEFYYVIKNNELYKVYKNDLDNEIYLYNIGTHSNVKVFKNNLYYLKDGYIYKYNKYGNRVIVFDNELKYNTSDIMYYIYLD